MIQRTLTNKEIKDMAGMLSSIGNLTCERHWVDGAELIAQGHTEDEHGTKFVVGLMYEQRFPVVLAVNHYRNMKKMFKKHGDQGVLTYINEVNKHKIISDELARKDSKA